LNKQQSNLRPETLLREQLHNSDDTCHLSLIINKIPNFPAQWNPAVSAVDPDTVTY